MVVCDTVELIKQRAEQVESRALSFHGDVVFIGTDCRVIQWNVFNDAVMRLDGYTGLIV